MKFCVFVDQYYVNIQRKTEPVSNKRIRFSGNLLNKIGQVSQMIHMDKVC